ncbi:MAG: CBS domain-containing protein [Planctomycetota bacterium]
MGEQDIRVQTDEKRHRAFTRAILNDLQALERMIEQGMIETGVRRIGAELEMFLIDEGGEPKNMAMQVLDRLDHPGFTTELAQFNLETNLSPRVFGGDCLRRMETEMRENLLLARTAAKEEGGSILLTGILPTLKKAHLGLDSMSPNERYRHLNDAITAARGGEFSFLLKGIDELDTTHDNVMLESCNTSFQIHFQVAPHEFARFYNLAQAITAPVLAAAVNSPVLLGKRLWQETRVALFRQSVDTRSRFQQSRGIRPRVSFGDHWVDGSIIDVFREDIARFRAVLATEVEEDALKLLSEGGVPNLDSLRLFNGTVYRWNRACYGVGNGVPHLRIENRVLPAGPTVHDQMANAAFFFGLMSALAEEHQDIRDALEFDHAKDNFTAAARTGLRAQFVWTDGKEYTAQKLILEHLVPKAREGLELQGLDPQDIDRYLSVLEERVESGRTGAQWMLDSLTAMKGRGTTEQRTCSLVRSMRELQRKGDPVHTWKNADFTEETDWPHSYVRVNQFMTTDLFTVQPNDVVDLAASLMDWRHIRHVPVEDEEGHLVGLVSHRTLLRLVGKNLQASTDEGEERTVGDIMKTNVVTVASNAPTLEAIQKMRAHRISCLPVVDGERLVGIVTERDLIHVAARLLEQTLLDAQGSGESN